MLRLIRSDVWQINSDLYETDFLVADEDLVPIMLIQVTDDLATSPEREIRGLLSAMKELGLNEGYVLTYDDYEDISIDGCRIYVRPVYEFPLYK